MLRVLALAGAAVAFAAAVGGAAAAPARDTLVRPGVGIGRISIGMTPAQVQRALGRPTLVNRTHELGFGRRYVEHDWDYGRWTIGYEGPRGRLRVVRVATTTTRERTPAGIGVGTLPRAVLRAFPGAQCTERQRTDRIAFVGRYLTVRAPNGRVTAFLVSTPWYGRDRTSRVIEVLVAQRRLLPGEWEAPCRQGWQDE